MTTDLVPQDYYDNFDDGLGELDQSELATPRLKINHELGVFEDSLSGEQWETIKFIPLGVVPQRTYFDEDIDAETSVLCRSRDRKVGIPDQDAFPWDEASHVPGFEPGSETLDCATCPFSEWTEKRGKRKAPACSEQLVMPLLLIDENDGSLGVMIFSAQRTSLGALKAYAASFKAKQRPLFTSIVEATLTPDKAGSNEYFRPKFKKVGDTDGAEHARFADKFLEMRAFLRGDRTEASAATEPAYNETPAPSQPDVPVAEVVDEVPVVDAPDEFNQDAPF